MKCKRLLFNLEPFCTLPQLIHAATHWKVRTDNFLHISDHFNYRFHAKNISDQEKLLLLCHSNLARIVHDITWALKKESFPHFKKTAGGSTSFPLYMANFVFRRSVIDSNWRHAEAWGMRPVRGLVVAWRPWRTSRYRVSLGQVTTDDFGRLREGLQFFTELPPHFS